MEGNDFDPIEAQPGSFKRGSEYVWKERIHSNRRHDRV